MCGVHNSAILCELAAMGIEIRIEGPICLLVVHDSFTSDDFMHAWDEAMRRPDFVSPMKVVFDIRELRRRIPAEEIEAMVVYCESVKHKFARRSAIVCEPGTLVYGLVRMFCAISESQGLAFPIFPKLEESMAWVADNSPVSGVQVEGI